MSSDKIIQILTNSLFNKYRQSIIALLRFIANSGDKFPYTREILHTFKSWEYYHKIIKICEELGLIERFEDYCWEGVKYRCKFARLTSLGYAVLNLFK